MKRVIGAMLRGIYTRLIREKFFNRMFIAYTVIIILILAAISLVITHSQASSVKNEAFRRNIQVVDGITGIMQGKYNAVLTGLNQLYENPQDNTDVFYILKNNFDPSSPEYVSKIQSVNGFIHLVSQLDNDVNVSGMLSTNDNMLFQYTTTTGVAGITEAGNASQIKSNFKSDFFGIKFLAWDQVNPGTGQSQSQYYVGAAVKSIDMKSTVGILLVNFDTQSLQNILLSATDFNCDVQIFTDSGNLIYESNPGEKSMYSAGDVFQTSARIVSDANGGITEISPQNALGLTIYSRIDPSQISRYLAQSRNTALFVFLVCLLCAVALSYTCASLFSRRVKSVNSVIRRVQGGDLTSRIHISNNIDEIGKIACNFNEMCDSLEEYIEKVYVSELEKKRIELNWANSRLRQKSAELFALQSQIDPHFLYNTLEAIRVCTLSEKRENIRDMIKKLAMMFRSNAHSEMFVSIREEVSYCQSYLDLMNYRYDGQLAISIDISEEALALGIIKHTLQPIIENAVIHGMLPDKRGNSIHVSGSVREADVIISIEDSGHGIDDKTLNEIKEGLNQSELPNRDHIGILNVNQRIKFICGDEYGLKIISVMGAGTTVKINIPAKTVKEMEELVQGYAG